MALRRRPTILYPDDMSRPFFPSLGSKTFQKARHGHPEAPRPPLLLRSRASKRNWDSLFLLVHEGINFIARPFSNLVLATFEKTVQGNLVGSSWVIRRLLVSLVGCVPQFCMLPAVYASLRRQWGHAGVCTECAECAECARFWKNKRNVLGLGGTRCET